MLTDQLKPLLTVGLRSRDRGSEGIVKVRLEAETGLEEKPHKKPNNTKSIDKTGQIVDKTTIFATFKLKLLLLVVFSR